MPATELVLRDLLPLAHQGLSEWGVSDAARERYLGVIEQRALHGVTGASWQVAAVERLEAGGLDRAQALRRMLAEYAARMHANVPVHTWDLP